jgi:ferrous iron transport protein B
MNPRSIVALAGSPNAGKSVLFNALTGMNQKVGNYPGVTVERKEGLSKPWNGERFEILDLPGTYSLDPVSLDEQIAFDVLMGQGKFSKERRPEIIIGVIDAANLERSLGLILQLKEINLPVIVCLNMMDIAQKRGLKLNIKKLQSELGLPVVPVIATRGEGIAALMSEVYKASLAFDKTKPVTSTPASMTVSSRFQEIDRILGLTVETPTQADLFTWKIDRVVLHPFWGLLILGALLLIMFEAVFSWAGPAADSIDSLISLLNSSLKNLLPDQLLTSLLTDGIIAGTGSVLVFLPQIILLFFFINLLEASGYMTRAAFILDRMMFSCGLQGRSFVPLLSSFACAIPGVMATRSIRNERDRLLTIMIAPLMACSARLPVYTLLIGAFVPSKSAFLGFNMQALAMFALFIVGVISAFVVAWVSRITGTARSASFFMLEMPSYRAPYWRYIFVSIWHRVLSFVKRAGTIILGSSVIIWVLSTYPKPPTGSQEPAITYSYAGIIGKTLEPIVAPIGFDWRIATSLIPGLAAREVMVSALATVFAVEAAGDEALEMTSLETKIRAAWAPATGFSLLAWYVFAPQCISTIATVKRETGRWKWALIMTAYMFALAWTAAFLVFKISS